MMSRIVFLPLAADALLVVNAGAYVVLWVLTVTRVVRYPRLITGESVLLVDDVFTTGATVSSCANALIGGGAKEVFVLTIARTML